MPRTKANNAEMEAESKVTKPKSKADSKPTKSKPKAESSAAKSKPKAESTKGKAKKTAAPKKERKMNARGRYKNGEMITPILTPARPSVTGVPANGEEQSPGTNAKYLRIEMKALSLPPIDTKDPQQVMNRAMEYLQFCESEDMKPHLVGLASWIGVDRSTIWLWKTGQRQASSGVKEVIERICNIMEAQWADYMLNGKVNPASGIFLGKNWYNYRDEQAVTVRPDSGVEAGNAEAARQKYLQNLEGRTGARLDRGSQDDTET